MMTEGMMHMDDQESNRSGAADKNHAEEQLAGAPVVSNDDKPKTCPRLSSTSSCNASSMSFWCQFFLWPVAFLILNGVLFGYFLTIGRVDSGLNRFWNNSIVTAILSALDAVALYCFATSLEKAITCQLQLDDASDTDISKHHRARPSSSTYAQASRKIDVFLLGKQEASRRYQPKDSILLQFLYLATVLASAASLTSIAFCVYASTRSGAEACSSNISPASLSNGLVDGKIPNELQTHVSHDHGADDRGMFAHMTDGVTYFAANNKPPSMLTGYINSHLMSPTYLLATHADGSVKMYKNVAEPRMFRSIQGDKTGLDTKSFCCTFSEDNARTTKIMCLASLEEVSANGFRNITLSPIPNGWYLSAETATAHKGEYWYARRFSLFPNVAQGETMTSETIEYYKLRPETMNMVLVESVQVVKGELRPALFRPGACRLGLECIGCFMACLILVPASAWLLHACHMPVGIAPACLVVFAIISYLSDGTLSMPTMYTVVVCSYVALVLPCWDTFGREAVTWILYTTMACLPVVGALHSNNTSTGLFLSVFMACSILAIALALDHPIPCVIGWAVGSSAAAIGSLVLVGGGPEGFLLILVGTVAGIGFVSFGSFLSKHHSCLQLHTRAAIQRWIPRRYHQGSHLFRSKLSRKTSYDISDNHDFSSNLLLEEFEE